MSKIITKKQVLTNLYNEFVLEINKHIDVSSVFPDLKDVDLYDMIFLINMHFGSTEEYHYKIQDLLNMHQIKIDIATFELIYPIVKTFLDKFKNI